MKRIYCLLMLLMFSGCSDKPVEPLVYGANTWPGYAPAYVARELGFLDESHVHLAEFTNTTEVVRAFRNGQLHIAGVTLDEAIQLRQSTPDLQVFMVVDVSHGADVLMARRDIKNLGQLKGKRIGVEKTALGAYFLSLILREAQLSANDVHIVSLPPDEHVAAYSSGLLDAVVSFGIVRNELSRLGAVMLFDSTQVPGKIVDTLVVRAADADTHRKHLRDFVDAWFRALTLIQTDPARTTPIMARHEGAKIEEIENTLHGLVLLDRRQNVLQLSSNPEAFLNTASEIQRVLVLEGLAAGSVDLTQLINPSFVAENGLD